MSPDMANPAIEANTILTTAGSYRPIHIVLPFYRNPDLVTSVFESLLLCGQELSDLQCSLIVIDDSPTNELDLILQQSVRAMSRFIPARVIKNEINLGFVKSSNIGIGQALQQRCDTLLLNSDTQLFPGAISNMRKVAYEDPMIGFVSPRSNNATICSLPVHLEYRDLSPEQSFRLFSQLHPYLPEYHYVPTTVGFCMFIKWNVLSEFGLLDEVYGRGYNEENDLVMRANRCGFRAALANRAFVYHLGEASFSQAQERKALLDEANSTILNQRYPEYLWSVRAYLDSPHYEFEQMLSALLPDSSGRVDVLIEMSNVTAAHNGTFQSARQILIHAASAWKDWCNLHVLISPEALAFHGLDTLENVYFVPPETDKRFAISLHIGQPFKLNTIKRMNSLGILNYWVMLDTIAWDCQYLHQLDETLTSMWQYVCEYSAGIFYISKFVQEQFRRRFRIAPHVEERVVYLSMDPADHRSSENVNCTDGHHILILGNHYEHKFLKPTVQALVSEFPLEKIVVIGLSDYPAQRVLAYPSGQLSDQQIENLFSSCKFLVYPSHSEGFGLPIVKALAYCKPVVARSLPTTRELVDRLGASNNVTLYDTTAELLEILHNEQPRWSEMPSRTPPGWNDYVEQVGNVMKTGLDTINPWKSVLPRLQYVKTMLASGNGATPIAQPDSHKEQLQRKCDELNAQNQNLHLALADRMARIADLQSSISWRMTSPVRMVGGRVLKLFNK